MNPLVHTIRIAGSETRFAASEGDNLLRAGLRCGIGLPYECNAGGCGSCKFELVSGEVQELWPEAPGLNTKDRARGRRLACQCRAVSDCEIRIRPSESFLAARPPRLFTAEYVGSRDVTSDIREFRFRGPEPAEFSPGQYALVTLPGAGQPRAYSMSNQPNQQGEWDFMIRKVPGGKVSSLLFESLRTGDKVEIDGPLGFANWRHESPRNVVCIAGGSGIAPIVSIANAALRQGRDSNALWLFYGGRTPSDIPDFDLWLHDTSRVRTHAAVSALPSDERRSWTGEQGFIHEVLGRTLTGDLAANEYYLAGPPPMIEVLVRMLMVDHKVPAQQIHYDRFF